MNIETFFEGQTEIIKRELKAARTSVHIAVAWLNFDRFQQVFIDLLEIKVAVNIVCSSNHSNLRYLPNIENLRKKGAKITLLKMPNLKNHMHHKFCVIDSEKILNGSFNWSDNAVNSFENLMIVTGDADTARNFLTEFRRLQLIETQSIRKLQKRKKCRQKKCDGELINILVYAENSSKYGVLTGDLVQTCNSCTEYVVLSADITSENLDLYLKEYEHPDNTEEGHEISQSIQEELCAHMNNELVVHAIGKIERRLVSKNEDEIFTNIIWKNVFAAGKVPDRFEDETFGIHYDSTYYI